MSDIENYKFEDEEVIVCEAGDDEVLLTLNAGTDTVFISAFDVVMLARHFGVTSNDIEET